LDPELLRAGATSPVAERPRVITPTFLLVTMANFGYFLTIGMLIPALPRYVEGPLRLSNTAVGLAVGAFSLAAVVSYPFLGRLGDARGRRLLIVAGGGLVALSVGLQVVTETIVPLVVCRLLMGIGGASFYVGVASTINDLAPEERRAEALSYFSLALYSGLALGPVVGELILEGGSFDRVWLIAAAASGVAALAGLLVPDTRPAKGEARSRKIWHRAAVLPGMVLATSVVGLAGFNSFVPLYALDLGMDGARLVFVAYAVVVLLLRSVGARIPDRFGPAPTARVALACSATGLAVIALWSEVPGLFVGAVVFAVGQALAFPALMTAAIRGAPGSERAAVVATFTAFFDASFGLGAVALGAVASGFDYREAFFVASAVAVGGLALLLARARRPAA
jgi:MFS family permease